MQLACHIIQAKTFELLKCCKLLKKRNTLPVSGSNPMLINDTVANTIKHVDMRADIKHTDSTNNKNNLKVVIVFVKYIMLLNG